MAFIGIGTSVILDARVGGSAVTSIYLGSTVLWRRSSSSSSSSSGSSSSGSGRSMEDYNGVNELLDLVNGDE